MTASSTTAEELFSTFFWPLYPPDVTAETLAEARTEDANPGENPSVLAHLREAALIFSTRAVALFGVDLGLDFSDASVHRLSAALTPARVRAWQAKGGPGTPDNELFNIVVHGAAYVGECILHETRRDGRWSVRRPLWESVIILRSQAGEAHLSLFQWFLKSIAQALSADEGAQAGPRGSLADRYRTYVEVPTFPADSLPVLAPPDRRLPRIVQAVRYDALYKHLKAHLPELRDLGHDFPSPERFAQMEFRWLDFLLVGDGRMVLVYGPGEGGLHLLWLDGSGFQKASFIPTERFPDPVVKLEGAELAVIVSVDGNPVVHRMLWWGP